MQLPETLDNAFNRLAAKVITPRDAEVVERVQNGLRPDGKPNLDGIDYYPLRSPDGSIWRIRVDNAGALSVAKEV